MAKKYYSTKVVGVGGQVSNFLSAGKMLVMFDDSMVLPELRDISVLHSGNQIHDIIKSGDILKIIDTEFKIVKVGNDVQKNLINLGHVVIKFDGGTGELLEGSIHVEDKPIPKIQVGDEISITEGTDTSLKGKTAAISNPDSDLGKTLAQILRDSGVTIVLDKDKADIFVDVK